MWNHPKFNPNFRTVWEAQLKPEKEMGDTQKFCTPKKNMSVGIPSGELT